MGCGGKLSAAGQVGNARYIGEDSDISEDGRRSAVALEPGGRRSACARRARMGRREREFAPADPSRGSGREPAIGRNRIAYSRPKEPPIMRKPDNIPTPLVRLCNRMICRLVCALAGWGLPRTRCQIVPRMFRPAIAGSSLGKEGTPRTATDGRKIGWTTPRLSGGPMGMDCGVRSGAWGRGAGAPVPRVRVGGRVS